MAPRRAAVVLILLTAGLIGFDIPPATAVTSYVVTTTEDAVNAGDGVLSLREAITLANADTADSQITLVADQVHALTACAGSAGEILNVSGDLNSKAGSGTSS